MSRPLCTVCVLCYGDYESLARRCLEPLRSLWRDRRILFRLGANAVGRASADYLNAALEDCGEQLEHTVNSEVNLYKYPVMWRLFHERPIVTPYVMWFDDDSWITAPNPSVWLDSVLRLMENADVLGSLYTQNLRGRQHDWVASRPWYEGGRNPAKAVRPGQKVTFLQGAWWTVRSEILTRWRWPEVEIIHRGGDVMFGELCRQQSYRMLNLPKPKGVAINADTQGAESKSKRRGFDEPPVGTHYRA